MQRRSPVVLAMLASVAGAGAAHASDAPIYAPAPAWVLAAPPIDATKLTDASPVVVRYDSQQRLENGSVWSYQDMATRAVTAQQLGQIGDVRLQWQPAHGDLVIHTVEILRGEQRIDLLAGKKPFTVLRREPGLDQKMLDGVLTATLAPEGLSVGDVLHVAFSTVRKDPTLKGDAQAVALLPAAPMPIGFGRARLSWPAASDVKWKFYADAPAPKPVVAGGWREIEIALPLPKPAEVPDDAPARFARPPLIEASSFADWPAVSKALAPLYATDGLIVAGSPLDAEVRKIAAAESDPLRRAAAALQLVQDKVRYLMLGMDTGNYVPQTPAQTWERRYGDCKAKTLLLLAMLHGLGIEAEAVAANLQLGELVPDRLPSVGAFNHVLVRATIGGKSYWLEGTGSGTRLVDIADTPRLGSVLPLRLAGAGLMPVALRASARPDVLVDVDLDDRGGVDTPTLMKASVTFRGALAEMVGSAASQANAEQRAEVVNRILTEQIGSGEFVDPKIDYDAAGATATVSATGVLSTRWAKREGRYRLTLDQAVEKTSFKPDRARAAWAAIPVNLPGPGTIVYRTTLHLPDGGTGYAIEGDRTLPATLAGKTLRRTVAQQGDTIVTEDRVEETGGEIAAADVPAVRAALSQAGNRLLTVVAPADGVGTFAYYEAARRRGATKPVEAMFARVIQARPKETGGYTWRARFRSGSGDRAGAIADYTSAIAVEPSADLYLTRAGLYEATGAPAKQLADIEAARKLDPESDPALLALANYQAAHGKSDAALALIDARLDRTGSKDRTGWLLAKAELQAEGGQRDAALATLDGASAEKPGNAELLNARCWRRGTGNVALDGGLRDCTKAIELDEEPTAALDSRAMIYFRMGRFDDALADLGAALDAQPDLAASRYLKGVILRRNGKAAEGDAELTRARSIAPQIDKDYARWGIVP